MTEFKSFFKKVAGNEGGLNWVIKNFCIDWVLFRDIKAKAREIKEKKLSKSK